MSQASRDQNFVPTLLGVSNADGTTPITVYADPVTHRLLVDIAGGGTGTVTSVSVVTANGLAGTVATATTTPAITLSTTITGILKGDGTAISAATAGTDYTALAFKTIVVAGQSDIVADGPADTLTIVAGTNVTLTTDATTDTLTINSTAGGGTPGSPVDSIQFNNSGSFAGSSTLLFDGTNVISFGAEDSEATLLIPDATTPDTNGGSLLISSGQGDGTGNAGQIELRSGAGGETGNGGDVSLISGDGGGTSGNAGDVILTGGDAVDGDGGSVILKTGLSAGTGGAPAIQGQTNYLEFGPTIYAVNDYPSDTNAYLIIDKDDTASDATVVFRDQGDARAEIGIAGDSDIHFKTVTGNYGSESFVDRMTIKTSGKVGIGTSNLSPDGLLHVTGSADDTNLFIGEVGATRKNFELAYNFSGDKSTMVSILRGTAYKPIEADSSEFQFYQGAGSVALVATMNTSGLLLAENSSIQLDPVLSADGKYTGTTISGTAGATLAFGDLVYFNSSSKWVLADADAASTSGSVMLGFCVLAAAADTDPTVVLLDGNIRADTAFPTFTVGAPIYVSATAGDVTTTQPSSTDQVIRVVGFALTADSMFVRISPDYITHA